ncbi:hypothetical protein N7462_009596 [Penicillium macrosclerotiorum]|uniref:uncharacterized protein n=1 Tax=Penicillium macrosclerotiorum TaxID=303699 RepID=UPI0025470E27|nr:uncharacterized protein N7462_009596 [Penicillium macrosclerotiorum]KAJ5674157.1 hypothetical protein N7462_009596 [Penicillium macrosclerotiorum]
MNNQLILITGVSGFIATHIVDSFIRAGYLVRGTVRSPSTAEKVSQTFPEYVQDGRLTFAIVQDITSSHTFDEAVTGVTGVIHTAAPFQFQTEDNERDLLKPSIEGTKNLLNSIQMYAPGVQRVVLTSSFASIIDLYKGNRAGYLYKETDWNPVTYEEAAFPGTSPVVAYCASKTLAEREAWNFVERECPSWDLTTICAPLVYGPNKNLTANLAHLNTSSADLYRLMSPTSKSSDPVPTNVFWVWADVRDVANAHLRAFELPEAGGQRFLVSEGRYSYQMMADVLRERILDIKERVPLGLPGSGLGGAQVYGIDNSKSKQVLGMSYRTFEESVVDAGRAFLALEAQEAALTRI